MKELRKLFIVELVVFFILFLGIVWIFYSIFNRPFDYLNLILGAVFAFLFAGVNMLTIYSLLKAKLNFLNSGTVNVPSFADKIESSFQVDRPDFSFEVVKYKIKEHYHVVLYDDIEQYVIKFHSGISPTSWGVGGTVSYDAVSKTISVVCFPLNPYTEKAVKNTQAVLDKVEVLIKNK